MISKYKFGKQWIAGISGAALAVAVGVALHQFTFGSGLVNLSYDLLTVLKPVVVPTNAVLVSIALYNEQVPQFEQLLRESGSLEAFYARARELAKSGGMKRPKPPGPAAAAP